MRRPRLASADGRRLGAEPAAASRRTTFGASRRETTRLLAVIIVCVVTSAAVCQAQADFSKVELTVGDLARITQPSGLRLTGVVRDISPRLLTLDGRRIQPEQGLTIERLGDATWNGTLIGIAVGGGLGAGIPRRGCSEGATAACILAPAVVFGAIGFLVDRAHVGHTTVFVGTASGSSAKRQNMGPNHLSIVVNVDF